MNFIWNGYEKMNILKCIKRISSIESQNYKQDILFKYHAMNSSQFVTVINVYSWELRERKNELSERNQSSHGFQENNK